MGRWKGGGHGRALSSSSSSQSLAGRRGQSFSLNPPCSCLSLAPLLPEENLLFSFPSQFLGDIWMRAAMERSLCPSQPLPTCPPFTIALKRHLQLLPAQHLLPQHWENWGQRGRGPPKGKHQPKEKRGNSLPAPWLPLGRGVGDRRGTAGTRRGWQGHEGGVGGAAPSYRLSGG